MKMTIDEAITWLNTDDYESKGFADATSVAIDTMQKYQKIKQIVDFYNNGVLTPNDRIYAFGVVRKVVEDAKYWCIR